MASDLRGLSGIMTLAERFRVTPGTKVKLREIDPDYHGTHLDKDAVAGEVQRDIDRMAELQALLYADNRKSLLICLQGLDGSGKDGTVAHVFRGMNPEGVETSAFKVPTREELAHDFLWRVHKRTPASGKVAIFNRSHYEDVLVVRVHKTVPKDVWSTRYDRINEFEKQLSEAGTTILKFFLHISEDEQLRRFEQRLDDRARQWKISESDYEERKFWPDYIEAFEDVLHKTSTSYAPWFVIPANHKWYRNLAVASIVVNAMESLRLKVPPPTVNLDHIRKEYHAMAKGEHRAEKRSSLRA
jgi:PPK2 family polyphosphate:nucleotide phosphotransferase